MNEDLQQSSRAQSPETSEPQLSHLDPNDPIEIPAATGGNSNPGTDSGTGGGGN